MWLSICLSFKVTTCEYILFNERRGKVFFSSFFPPPFQEREDRARRPLISRRAAKIVLNRCDFKFGTLCSFRAQPRKYFSEDQTFGVVRFTDSKKTMTRENKKTESILTCRDKTSQLLKWNYIFHGKLGTFVSLVYTSTIPWIFPSRSHKVEK